MIQLKKRIMNWKTDARVVCGALLLGQIGVFYIAANRCTTQPDPPLDGPVELKALVVSDVHLLGKRRRTFVERLWIDTQISISLLSAVHMHRPDVILVLGDQLDEGGYPTSDADFQEYVDRFKAAFPSSVGVETIYLMGNHDSAFGRFLTPGAIARHERAFGPSNHVTKIKNHKIIQLNTMALDSDIEDVEIQAQAASFLETLQHDSTRERDVSGSVLLLTHFPLHRKDDLHCGANRLREHGHVTYEHPSFLYTPHHHVLSEQLSHTLLKSIQPDVVLSGHTHAWCEYQHQNHERTGDGGGAKEYTIPAFSWGQRPDPSYAILAASGNHVRVTSCALPRETDVFFLYSVALSIVLVRLLWRCRCLVMSRSLQSGRHSKKAA